MHLLRLPAVIEAVALKKSTIYRRLKNGSFPSPVKLGARAVAWRADDIQQWIASRPSVLSPSQIHGREFPGEYLPDTGPEER
jgi:prophage regulatory protein